MNCPQCGCAAVLDHEIYAYVCPQCGSVLEDKLPETLFFAPRNELGTNTSTLHDGNIGTTLRGGGVMHYRMIDASVSNRALYKALRVYHNVLLTENFPTSRCSQETGATILSEIVRNPDKYGLTSREVSTRTELRKLALASVLVAKLACNEIHKDAFKWKNLFKYIDASKRALTRLYNVNAIDAFYQSEIEYSLLALTSICSHIIHDVKHSVDKFIASGHRSLATPRLLVAAFAYLHDNALLSKISRTLKVNRNRVVQVAKTLLVLGYKPSTTTLNVGREACPLQRS